MELLNSILYDTVYHSAPIILCVIGGIFAYKANVLNIALDVYKRQHLSKAVQEQGFFWFRKQLEYKCSDKGIQLIVADRFYPSSKLCSCCGNIKKALKLSDRVYRCECGNMIDRDFQASINLKTYGEQFAS